MLGIDIRSSLMFSTGVVLCTAAACTPLSQDSASPVPVPEILVNTLERDADVPELPFPDNPDPNQCGIPTQWGLEDPAWVSGYYQGELVQPIIYLYDSHLRISIAGAVPSGTKVVVILYQQNPSLDYYLVKTVDYNPPQEGWIPAPFLSFDRTE
jgi:hypothetical protein